MQRLTPDRLESANARTRLSGAEPGAYAADVPKAANEAELRAAAEQAKAARLEQAFEEARSSGHAAGLADIEKEIVKRVDDALETMRAEHETAMKRLASAEASFLTLARSVPGALARMADEAEESAVEIAYAAVVRLLGDRSIEQQVLRDLCRKVAADHGTADALLLLSESDVALLGDIDLGIAVEVDRRLSPGQCTIDTARGRFDTGLDVRLDGLKHAFLSGLTAHRRSI